MSTDDLLTDGIAKFPLIEKLSNSYQEWFGVMTTRLDRNYPYIYEKFVLVKVTCENPKDRYYFSSYNKNIFSDQITRLDIYNKGFRHKTTTVTILRPNFINKSIQMKEYNKGGAFSQWEVDDITRDHIGEDSYFIILCLKK